MGSSYSNSELVSSVVTITTSTFDQNVSTNENTATGGGAIASGWTAPTRYLGSNVTPPAGSPAQVGGVHKGAWPQSFVNFHGQTGTAAYWYSSGAAADPLKVQEPVGVHYSLNP